MTQITGVPTNIITGALGVGKTTLIQSLIKQKPADERWAILVNEFGEVGIDGAIMSGQDSKDVFIKEVPGGCMCCTSGLPMQIALNLLLAQAKPDRLLIEPTGLGHPKEVMETLSADHYKDVLDVHATLTLIDLRKLEDERWRQHATFQQQMQIADVIVVTKSDLYDSDYSTQFDDYLSQSQSTTAPVITADHGRIDLSLLAKPQLPTKHHDHDHDHDHDHQHTDTLNLLATPSEGVISVRNQGEGYFSRGWICARDKIFNFDQCDALLRSLNVERLKAVLITDQGPYGFNVTDDTYESVALDTAEDSRVEFIVDNEADADSISERLRTSLNLDDN